MLRSQPPRTPTRWSNQLTAQATAEANSLSMSTTPTDPGTSCALSVRPVNHLAHGLLSWFQRSLWLPQHAQPGHRPPKPTPRYPQPPSFPNQPLVLSMVELPTLPHTLKLICPHPRIPMLVTMVPCLPTAVTRTCFRG